MEKETLSHPEKWAAVPFRLLAAWTCRFSACALEGLGHLALCSEGSSTKAAPFIAPLQIALQHACTHLCAERTMNIGAFGTRFIHKHANKSAELRKTKVPNELNIVDASAIHEIQRHLQERIPQQLAYLSLDVDAWAICVHIEFERWKFQRDEINLEAEPIFT
jgi:hypothetical protein